MNPKIIELVKEYIIENYSHHSLPLSREVMLKVKKRSIRM